MGLTGLLSLLVIGGLAAGGFYYRDNIKSALKDNRSDEEKDYDFERKQNEDSQWDSSGWNPDNWGVDNWFPNDDLKVEPKDEPKDISAFTPIQVIDPQTGQKTITVIPNIGVASKKKTAAGWY